MLFLPLKSFHEKKPKTKIFHGFPLRIKLKIFDSSSPASYHLSLDSLHSGNTDLSSPVLQMHHPFLPCGFAYAFHLLERLSYSSPDPILFTLPFIVLKSHPLRGSSDPVSVHNAWSFPLKYYYLQ